MIYLVGGLASTLLMLGYRRPPGRSSPLWEFESSDRARRTIMQDSRVVSWLCLSLSFLILTCISASRYGIGTDYWPRYVPIFQSIAQGQAPNYEPGFVFLNRAVAAFTNDPQWLIAVAAVITIALVYRFIVRMSVAPALSVFVFVFAGFYLESFNIVRQWLAVAILLNTIEFAMRRRVVPLVLLTLLAASFHASALVWLVTVPLLWARLGRLWRLLTVVVAMLFVSLLPELLSRWVAELAPAYSWYFESNYGDTRAFDLGTILVSIFVLAAALPLRSRGNDARYVSVLVSLQTVYVVFLAATVVIAYLFIRPSFYYAPVEIVLVPAIFAAVKNSLHRTFFLALFCISLLVVFTFKFIVWNAHGVMPYVSVFG